MILDRLSIIAVPLAVLLAVVLVNLAPSGAERFGLTVLALVVIIPLGAIISIFCSIRVTDKLLKAGAWPDKPKRKVQKEGLMFLGCIVGLQFLALTVGAVACLYLNLLVLSVWSMTHIVLNRRAREELRVRVGKRKGVVDQR